MESPARCRKERAERSPYPYAQGMVDAQPRHAWIRPIPNILTVLRIVAAAALPFVPGPWRLPVVLFGTVSDWADGVIARRFHAQTKWGAFMDGVADKLLVAACVVTFVRSGDVALWQGLLVMARDLVVTALVTWMIWHHARAALAHVEVRRWGKITTALVLPWFASLLVPGLGPLRPWLFWPAALASVLAAADYARQFATLRPAPARDEGPQPGG
jgi:CDP-diacylglycerol--glycerol-3-phosphate 3-phosphatidyltransferase